MLQYLRRKKKITVCKIIFSQISDSYNPEQNIDVEYLELRIFVYIFGVFSYIYVTLHLGVIQRIVRQGDRPRFEQCNPPCGKQLC